MASLLAIWKRLPTEFASLVEYIASPGQELRRDPGTGTTDYFHGRAIDNASTADPVWEVVRFYVDGTSGEILRTRYRADVAWDSRASGW